MEIERMLKNFVMTFCKVLVEVSLITLINLQLPADIVNSSRNPSAARLGSKNCMSFYFWSYYFDYDIVVFISNKARLENLRFRVQIVVAGECFEWLS